MLTTPLFAAVFALIYCVLALLVVRLRLRHQVYFGDDNDSELERTVRAHANFNEYVPIALILIWFIETVCHDAYFAFYLALGLLVSRILQSIGMLYHKRLYVCRKFGTIGTFAVLIIAAVRLIWHSIPW